MKNRAFVRSVSCFLLVPALAGCGGGHGEAAADAIEMAFIPKTSDNLVFKLGNDGAQFGARALSNSSGSRVKVDYLAPASLDPAEQERLVRQAVAAKKDALLVSCIDDSLTDSIDEAVDAGIPVITYDSDCPSSKRLGFYSMSSEATGSKAAELLASAMGSGEKSIAILTGRTGADNLERRVAGFLDTLATTYPGISVVTTVHCAETAETCSAAVEDDIVARYPDLDGLFVVGLWGLLAACDCSENGLSCLCDDTQMPNWKTAAKGKLKTVAFDSLPFELALMKQGYVSALVGQKYFGWGYDTVSLMHEHLTRDRKVNEFIDSGFDVVCPNHADDMLSKWHASDFSTPLSSECELE